MVLPGMVKRRRGAVVNIGTAVSIFGSGALYSVYAGSKVRPPSKAIVFLLLGLRVAHLCCQECAW